MSETGAGRSVKKPLIRSLGDREVGPLAFGCWRFVPANVDDPVGLVSEALDVGMNLVDTADVYGLDWGGTDFGQAEALLGRALGAEPSLRERMVLATKGGIRPPVPYDSSPEWIRTAVTDSLRRMKVDRIDLYQIHRCDPFTHPAALAAVLDELVESGVLGSIGVSNHSVAQTRALERHLDAPLVSTQPEYSLVHLDPMRDGTFDDCTEHGRRPLVWSPLGGGRLATGEGIDGALLAVMDRLAGERGVDRSAVGLAFVLAHPSAPVAIVGSTRPDRLAGMVGGVAEVELTRAELYELIQASDGEPLP